MFFKVAHEEPRRGLLDRAKDGRNVVLAAWHEKDVGVVGHDDIGEEVEVLALPSLIEDFEEDIRAVRIGKHGHAAVDGEGERMGMTFFIDSDSPFPAHLCMILETRKGAELWR